MNEDELRSKFKALTKDLMAERDADTFFTTCMQLETLADISGLVELTTIKKDVVASHD